MQAVPALWWLTPGGDISSINPGLPGISIGEFTYGWCTVPHYVVRLQAVATDNGERRSPSQSNEFRWRVLSTI